jgi:hypothetical protein
MKKDGGDGLPPPGEQPPDLDDEVGDDPEPDIDQQVFAPADIFLPGRDLESLIIVDTVKHGYSLPSSHIPEKVRRMVQAPSTLQ